ncbi:uncharacterized protein LOC119744497 [Patiria miniata]|uniref:Uncharacterized protein n=1 Tax=Patiria miniata TaxID=46514 RepID=A0A914BKQ1_PATMI|nr:uncharacterized protein LOC119744497 [Patiria miniata]
MDSLEIDVHADFDSEFQQSGRVATNEHDSLEAKLQANSDDIKKLSSSFAGVQNMLLTLLNKDQEKEEAKTEVTCNSIFEDQGCFDPCLDFELISNVTANSPKVDNQGDFDILPCGDLYESTEAKGPEIFANLADRAIKAVTLPIKKKNYNKIAEKYTTLANSPAVTAPRVDADLWSTIPATARTKDVATQLIQKHVVKGMIPCFHIINELREATKSGNPVNSEKIKQFALDGITLSGNASYELSMKRREELKPCLNPMYRGLCSRNTPVTEKLFGQDLNGSMKQVAEAFKAGRKLTYSDSNKRAPRHQRYVPYTQRARGNRHGCNAERGSRDQPYGRSSTPSYYANTHSGNRRGGTFGRHQAKPATSTQDRDKKLMPAIQAGELFQKRTIPKFRDSGQSLTRPITSLHSHSTYVESSTVVPTATPHAHRQPNQTTGGLPSTSTPTTDSQPTPGRLGHLREHWKAKGFSIEASNLIANSWRSRTQKQYESAWKGWIGWCYQQKTNPLSPAIADIVNFLAHE